MTSADQDMSSIIEEAERRGREALELEKKNKIRRAKGLKPLPDEQARKDAELLRRRQNPQKGAVVDSADAFKLFEMRKIQMLEGGTKEAEEMEEPDPQPQPQTRHDARTDRAIREAEAVRRVEDLKNGRINHAGTWGSGGTLEGGDRTVLPHNSAAAANTPSEEQPQAPQRKKAKSVAELSDVLFSMFDDLYGRLRVSFEGLEASMSDLQGRVAEIVVASTPKDPPAPESGMQSEFEEMLSRKVPVVFDVGGTKMSFDAVTVFHASPCITVVSRFGSATIMPRPGSKLRLTYDMDGRHYENDPVVFLGTRFELPMFGLSFVGFIREQEAGDADAEEVAEG